MGLLMNLMGMGGMTEQVIATDFLLAAKNGVRNYALAVSEAATPVVKDILRRHLFAAIETHEKIMQFMIDKGYYEVYDPSRQIDIDMKAADTVINLHQNGF